MNSFWIWKGLLKKPLAFGRVLETCFDVKFESCAFMTYLLKERINNEKDRTHVDNMLTLVSVCGKKGFE